MKSSIKSELEQTGTNVHPMNVHVHAHMSAYVYVYMPGLNVLGIYSLRVYIVKRRKTTIIRRRMRRKCCYRVTIAGSTVRAVRIVVRTA